MIKPKILVTGATGRTGGAVVTQPLAKGYPVRATVRVRDARSDLLQRRGAEIVVADIFDPGQLMGPRFGEMSANVARDIREGRVRFVHSGRYTELSGQRGATKFSNLNE
jgi:nucleoside-diphosphate-sugar epimerase